jgi:hypothetical protein
MKQVMKNIALALAVSSLALVSAPVAFAHHSAAMFDFGKTTQVVGVIRQFELINPHMRLALEVTDAKGTRLIRFEGHSLNNMYRAGWRKDMVKLGDKLTVVIAPKRDGSDGGYVTSGITADGKRFGMVSSAEQAKALAEGRP